MDHPSTPVSFKYRMATKLKNNQWIRVICIDVELSSGDTDTIYIYTDELSGFLTEFFGTNPKQVIGLSVDDEEPSQPTFSGSKRLTN